VSDLAIAFWVDDLAIALMFIAKKDLKG